MLEHVTEVDISKDASVMIDRAGTDLVEGMGIGRIEETPESAGGDSKTTSPRKGNGPGTIDESDRVEVKDSN